ncbi:hypothetical protein [uncultured Pelagimonas sp.]|uniref:hypothetical protein n=1 Tax=uncultured Pelagimonas sp. TaxID=1618102 RepID=UPI002606721B|nr:hypothetical protein [uncultured Pelagimonas sp.]
MIDDINSLFGVFSKAFSENATVSLLMFVFCATLVLFFYMHHDISKTDSETGERGFWLKALHENSFKAKYINLLKRALQKLGSALTRYQLKTLPAPRLQPPEIRYIRKSNSSALSLGLLSFCLHAMILFVLIIGLIQWLPDGGKFEIARVSYRPPHFGFLRKLQSLGLTFGLILVAHFSIRLADYLLRRIWLGRSNLKFLTHRALFAIVFGAAFGILQFIFPYTLGLIISVLLALGFSGVFSGIFLVAFTGFYAFSFVYFSEWFAYGFSYDNLSHWGERALIILGCFWTSFSLATGLEWISRYILLAYRSSAAAIIFTIIALFSLSVLWAFTPDNVGGRYIPPIVLFIIFFSSGLSFFISSGATRYFLGQGLSGRPLRWASVDLFAGLCSLFLFGVFVSFIFLLNGDFGGSLDWVLTALLAGPGFRNSILNEPYSFLWFYATTFVALLPTILHLTIFSVSVSIAPVRPWRMIVSGLLMRGGRHRDAISGQFVPGFPGQGRLGLLLLSATVAMAVTGSVALVVLLWSITSNYHAYLGGFVFDAFRGLAFAMGMEIDSVYLD